VRAASPEAATLLASIEFASVATIVYVLPPGALTSAPPGSGALVPSASGMALSACTWYSIKWPHAAPPDGGAVVRSFVGRAGESDALSMSDDDLIERVARETEDVLDLRARPRAAHLKRWPRSLPQYRVGHVATVERIEAALRSTAGIWITGASYRGSGIPDCIRQARATAESIRRWLGP
jgi:oxygen-dependent protoporphyrinogen oxidase